MNKKAFYSIKFIVFIILLVISNGLLIYKIAFDNTKVVLKGEDKVIISYKSNYEEPGFEIIRNDKNIDVSESNYEVVSDVDTSKIGDYEVNYKVSFLNRKFNLTRIVEVRDTEAPVITASVERLEKSYCDNTLSQNIEYSAMDDLDGDVSTGIIREDTDDKVTLKVSDSSNNISILEIPIVTVEKPSNKVVLNGKAIQSIALGGKYTEEGAFYSDGCGKKIDDNIEISGSVDTNKVGKYTITYTSKTDKSFKNTRTITVYDIPKAQSAPVTGNSVIYLTFDDGPGYYTQSILDTLDKYNIKATFFVTNQFPKYQHMIAEEAKRGHTIGVHTKTHQWAIYSSLDAYWSDFNQMNDIIETQTGKRATILRFPGGTSNHVAKIGMSNVANSVLSKGYQYYDWNVCVEDAGACVKQSNKENCVYNYFVNYLQPGRDNIVLLHDIKSYTAASLERMIQYGISKGYTFKAIDNNTAIVHFKPYK